MSDTEWISLREAALRVLEIDIPTKYQLKLGKWPEIDPANAQLIEFAEAGNQGKIKARGEFTKAAFFTKLDEFDISANKLIIYDGLLNCQWELNKRERDEITRKRSPFVDQKSQEKTKTPIKKTFWGDFGQIWKHNQLIDFQYNLDSKRAQKLIVTRTHTYDQGLVNLRRERDNNFEISELPKFIFYDNVEVEAKSLGQWLTRSIPAMIQTPVQINRNPGAPDTNWHVCDDNIDDFIKLLEINKETGAKPSKFKNLPDFHKTFVDYIVDNNLGNVGLSKDAFVKGVAGSESASYKARAKYNQVLNYVDWEYKTFPR